MNDVSKRHKLLNSLSPKTPRSTVDSATISSASIISSAPSLFAAPSNLASNRNASNFSIFVDDDEDDDDGSGNGYDDYVDDGIVIDDEKSHQNDKSPLTWAAPEIKVLSKLRQQRTPEIELVNLMQAHQLHLRENLTFPDPNTEALKMASTFIAWVEENEQSTAGVRIINEYAKNPADACPPWDFVWCNGYVFDDSLKPSHSVHGTTTKMNAIDPIQGCDCDDDECDPQTCACVAKKNKMKRFEGLPQVMDFAYDNQGLLNGQVYFGEAIFECNSACGCSMSCRNRVVQKGRQVPIDFFMTEKRGWGIRSPNEIPNGKFIGLYAGELVSDKESNQRGTMYDRVGSTYLLSLDAHMVRKLTIKTILEIDLAKRRKTMNEDQMVEKVIELDNLITRAEEWEEQNRFVQRGLQEAKDKGTWSAEFEKKETVRLADMFWEMGHNDNGFFALDKQQQKQAIEWLRKYETYNRQEELCVDSALWGNFTRFFNHSCEPNMCIYPVWIDEPNNNRPLYAFFTTRSIAAEEELTFDYNNSYHSEELSEPTKHAKIDRAISFQEKTVSVKAIRCTCGTEKCRGVVFG